MKQLLLKIPNKFHAELKRYCSLNHISMKEYIMDTMRKELKTKIWSD